MCIVILLYKRGDKKLNTNWTKVGVWVKNCIIVVIIMSTNWELALFVPLYCYIYPTCVHAQQGVI